MPPEWTILATVAQLITSQIPARSRRQAMDWSLALASQGIETTIDFCEESGWRLFVPEQDYERAVSTIRQYRVENLRWPWRRKLSHQGILFDWGSIGWVALIAFFFWLQVHSSSIFRNTGLMDAAAVSSGQWWRLFTAIFLHADIGHLAMNMSIGFVLLGLTMGRLGTGVGSLAAYLTGVGGNVLAWLIYSGGHHSLGASGMIMGCLGLLAAQSVSPERGPNKLKYFLSGIIGGVMLFTLLGLNPESDVLAHLGGFVSGLALGTVLALAPTFIRSTASNIFAGVILCLLVILPWWTALTGTR